MTSTYSIKDRPSVKPTSTPPDPSLRSHDRRNRWRGSIWLAAWGLTIAIVWLVVLPRCSQLPSTADYLDQLDRRGIDASAMFYTELPMMKPLLE